MANQIISIQTQIHSALYSMNLNLTRSQFNELINRTIVQIDTRFSGMVSGQLNLMLNNVPEKLLGPYNPVDIITRNFNSSDLQRNIHGTISSAVMAPMTGFITNTIRSQLYIMFGKGSRILIDFDTGLSRFEASLAGILKDGTAAYLQIFTQSLFNQAPPYIQIIGGIGNSFLNFGFSQALSNLQFDFSRGIINKHLGLMANFDILNQDNQNKILLANRAFTDPDSLYPNNKYIQMPSDTNKLAQGTQESTIVADKNRDRMMGAKLPGDDSFSQPESPYKAQYPYNKVTQTESGHVFEIDDTPGAERIHEYHKSGTFTEIDSTGSVVQKIVGSSYTIIDRNGKISIQGKADISISGACNIYIGNDANIEIGGNAVMKCHQDITAMASGSLNLSGGKEVNIASGGGLNITAGSNLNITGKDINTLSEGNLSSKATGELNLESKDHHVLSENTRIQANRRVDIKSGSDTRITSGNELHLRVSSDYFLDADDYYVDENKSKKAASSKEANVATYANIGTLPDSFNTIPVDIPDPIALNFRDQYALLLEEPDSGEEEYSNLRDKLIQTGLVTSSDLVNQPVVLDQADGISSQVMMLAGNNDLKQYTSLPANFQLSPHITLGMVSSFAAVSKYPVREHSDLKYGDIVFNLHALTINILEPILALYPKQMIITSGFRDPGSSSSTSQHPKGMAADIQFTGISKSDYFDIAKNLSKLLNYDQFILEYSSYANNPWIHVSFNPSGNRKQVMTFWNHRKKGDGLLKLI